MIVSGVEFLTRDAIIVASLHPILFLVMFLAHNLNPTAAVAKAAPTVAVQMSPIPTALSDSMALW